jgi:hypothetical protein
MAYPVKFEGANVVLKAPPGQEETCGDLHVFRNRQSVVSCWKFEGDELAEIIRTGCVYASVQGPTQPPMYLAAETEMRAFTAEYGVMPKQPKETA